MNMNVHLPTEIEHYEPELRILFDLMIRKLHINRHKGFADQDSIAELRQYVYSELKELNRALDGESQFDVALEAVDVANCSILLAMRILRLDKQTFERERQQYRNGTTGIRKPQHDMQSLTIPEESLTTAYPAPKGGPEVELPEPDPEPEELKKEKILRRKRDPVREREFARKIAEDKARGTD